MVTIKVKRVCEAKMSGVPERLDYSSNSMEKVFLFPQFHLELCDMKCKGEEMLITSSVSLKTKHISFGCEFMSLSLFFIVFLKMLSKHEHCFIIQAIVIAQNAQPKIQCRNC